MNPKKEMRIIKMCLVLMLFSGASFLLGATLMGNKCNKTIENQRKVINAYINYHREAENLLDTLDKYDDWVDRFDPVEYYTSVIVLDSINK